MVKAAMPTISGAAKLGRSLSQMIEERFRLLQQRYGDPILTALTLMLVILLFVVSPLQATRVVGAHNFGIGFGFVLLIAVFVVSRSALAIGQFYWQSR
jgi:hypothetical protein